MTTVQSQSTSGANSIAQVAAQAALEGDQSCVPHMVESFKRRHDLALEILTSIPGVSCLPADGTFYLFPNMQGAIARLKGVNDDIALCDYLLSHANAAAVPGTPFGASGHIRLSIALAEDKLLKALEDMKEVLRGN
jgi:aspartate aminotransferase